MCSNLLYLAVEPRDLSQAAKLKIDHVITVVTSL